MITAVRAVPEATIVLMLADRPNPDQSIAPWHLISIRSESNGHALRPMDIVKLHDKYHLQTTLQLVFGDVECKEDADLWCVSMFTEKQALQVIRYLDRIHKGEEPELLIAQCFAGIARSGAVATFAVERYGLDHEKFLRDNPQVQPNSHVLALLHRTQRELENACAKRGI